MITVKIVTLFFLERQKFTGKLNFGKVLIKRGSTGAQAKKILKREELNVLYFHSTYGTICTTYVPYNMYMALYCRYMYCTWQSIVVTCTCIKKRWYCRTYGRLSLSTVHAFKIQRK